MQHTRFFSLATVFAVAVFIQVSSLSAADQKCPLSGKAVNPKCTLKYEGVEQAFCCGKCRSKFDEKLKASLYHRIGGKAAISAAVDAFYVKVLADKRVNHHFEDINMKRQHNKQKEFLAAAFGGPKPWTGKSMRRAHRHLELKESDFNIVAGHLVATLKELKVPADLINEAMTIAASVKPAVLNQPE